MNHPQSAILPDDCKSGVFIEADLIADKAALLQDACNKSLRAAQSFQEQFPETLIGLTIGFGSELWQRFNRPLEAKELKPFRALGNGLAPATQHDLMIHIQSLRQDVTMGLAQAVTDAFAEIWQVAHETHGYRLIENRGHDGFVDGTENPKDDDRALAAVIADGLDDAGGSYVLLQKYRHDLKKWSHSNLQQQETCIGRTKASDEELEDRAVDSHLDRTDLSEDGLSLKILRRSLPYGQLTGEHGLMFIAYCSRLHNIEAQLLSMFGETDGKIDLILRHLTTAISGAYYYAPSVERLQNLRA